MGSAGSEKRTAAFRLMADERIAKMNLSWIAFEQDGSKDAAAEFARELHTLKGEAALRGFVSASTLAHAIEDAIQPDFDAGSSPSPALGDNVLQGLDCLAAIIIEEPTTELPDAVVAVVTLLSGSEPKKPKTAKTPPTRKDTKKAEPKPTAPEDVGRSSDTIRVTSAKLDQMRDAIGELLLSRSRLESSVHELRTAQETAAEYEEKTEDEEYKRLCSMITQLLAGIESRIRESSHFLGRSISELESANRDLRMVPIRSMFERYPRAVRTMARKNGRNVRLQYEGEVVEVDRVVLGVIEEPLLHLVRNAVDHGIEDPTTREQAGKSSTGNLMLHANVVGATLHVDVHDDGAGIDTGRVRQRAVALGVLDQSSADALSEEQTLRLLFAAGMSTRTTVTELSGRGIGLNVVLENVESLGGNVRISTQLGHGSTFHLEVPLSIAITLIVLFRVGSARYALPATSVVAVLDQADHPIVDSVQGEAIHYQDALVPIVRLPSVLDEPETDDGHRGRILLARSGRALVAVFGSRDHSEREVVMKPVGSFFERDRLFASAAPLEDGGLALVLKASELVARTRGTSTMASAASTSQRGRTVLVVEDSPIIRSLVVEALRAHGLRVIEASDGKEALAQLDRHSEIDLVVTDVEMPRLDGIGLIRALRARGGARRLPAVVVSNRGSDEDKKRAIEAGADAYLVKSEFSQAGLWSIISRFLS